MDSVNRFVANFQLIKCITSFPIDDNVIEFSLRDNDLVMIEVKNDPLSSESSQLFAIVDCVTREVRHGKPREDGERGE